MKLLKISAFLCFTVLSTQVKSEGEVRLFEEPPSAQEILESFGEHVVKTRGFAKKTRVVVSQNAANVVKQNESSPVIETNVDSSSPRQLPKSPIAFPLVFALNSAELSNEAKPYVDSMAAALKTEPNLTIHISGHTDVSGSDEINKPLSLKRAASVKHYLESVHQINSARLEISGEGSALLFDANNPYAATNRRVQFEKK